MSLLWISLGRGRGDGGGHPRGWPLTSSSCTPSPPRDEATVEPDTFYYAHPLLRCRVLHTRCVGYVWFLTSGTTVFGEVH